MIKNENPLTEMDIKKPRLNGRGFGVIRPGLEPGTLSLKGRCSTN